MKVIIYRDKETKKIVRDGGDDYERLKERGKTDEDIAALAEEFNARENCPQKEMKRLCRDCPHCEGIKTGYISFRYWCGLTGDGYNRKAMGIYPWKNKPHPKCPLKEERKDD